MESAIDWRAPVISSLQTRLLLAVGSLAVASVVAVSFSARQSTRQEFERFRGIEQVRENDAISATLGRVVSSLDGKCCAGETIEAAAATLGANQVLFVFDPNGDLLGAAGRNIDISGTTATFVDGTMKIDARTRAADRTTGMTLSFKGTPMAPIRRSDGGAATVHVVSWPHPERDGPTAQFLGSVDRRLIVATVGVALLSLFVTWVVARRVVGPIKELRDATRDLARGDLTRRVSSRGSDEVADLAHGFNTMAEALERQENLRRNLVHDVAHELRTPLTALRCRVETVIDGLSPDPRAALMGVKEDVAHLSQLVGDLEELARAEARELSFTIAAIDIGEVCRSAVRAAGLDGDPRVRVQLEDGMMANADAMRARQVLVNLLTNADRHAPAGGVISIRLVRGGTQAIVQVHNTGSSLTPAELARVFDRFYRADPARQRATGGSGLGLAIAKQLAEAQGGSVRASSDDTGVTFELALPPSESA